MSPAASPQPGRLRRPFGARLADAMDDQGPLCVGIDPHPSLLDAWGLADSAAGLRDFALRTVDVVFPRARVGAQDQEVDGSTLVAVRRLGAGPVVLGEKAVDVEPRDPRLDVVPREARGGDDEDRYREQAEPCSAGQTASELFG